MISSIFTTAASSPAVADLAARSASFVSLALSATDLDLPNALFANTTRSDAGDTGTGTSVGHAHRGDRLGFINAVAEFVDEVAVAALVERRFEGLADDALGGGFVH